jgi:hypothetical protein
MPPMMFPSLEIYLENKIAGELDFLFADWIHFLLQSMTSTAFLSNKVSRYVQSPAANFVGTRIIGYSRDKSNRVSPIHSSNAAKSEHVNTSLPQKKHAALLLWLLLLLL